MPSSLPVEEERDPEVQLNHGRPRISLLGSLDETIPPTRQSFYSLHLLYQFPVVFLLLLLCIAVLGGFSDNSHWTEFILGVTAWLAGERLKELSMDLFSMKQPYMTIIHVVIQELFRLGLVWVVFMNKRRIDGHMGPATLSKKPHYYPVDDLYYRILWAALGWASIEVLAGCMTFWNNMKLYDPLLAEYEREIDDSDSESGSWIDDHQDPSSHCECHHGQVPNPQHESTQNHNLGQCHVTLDTIAEEQSGDRSALLRIQDRAAAATKNYTHEASSPTSSSIDIDETCSSIDIEEGALDAVQDDIRYQLEQMLGMPLYTVPVALILIWRLDSFLLSINLSLLESYPLQGFTDGSISSELLFAWLSGVTIHITMALAWLYLVRRAGLAVMCYVSLVIMLAMLMIMLNLWHIIS